MALGLWTKIKQLIKAAFSFKNNKNKYNMGLNLIDYQTTFQPHLSYRFKVEFASAPNLVTKVKDIKLPTFEINASDGRKRYGQTQIVLPVFNFGDMEMEITFVENDNMDISNYLTSKFKWPNQADEEDIIVYEYDETLKNVIKVTKYTAVLFSYNAPQWQNSGSPGRVDITATYVVRDILDITDQNNTKMHQIPVQSESVNLEQDLNSIGTSVDAETMTQSEWETFLASLNSKPKFTEDNTSDDIPTQEPVDSSKTPVKDPYVPVGAKYSTMTPEQQVAYLKQTLKKEISGEATNGHSRKEGNDNQVYMNRFDSTAVNPTQMNYGYGNTYAKLQSLGADKVGEITFTAKKDVVINGKKYKKGEQIKFANLSEANKVLAKSFDQNGIGANALVLDQSSADKLNDLVLNDMAKKMQKSFKQNNVEDVIDNMNENARMGLTHMIYGGEGTMNNVVKNLNKNKTEVLDSLQNNNGYLGADYADKHANDKGSKYKSTNKKTGDTMSWNRLDYMSERGKTITRTKGNA